MISREGLFNLVSALVEDGYMGKNVPVLKVVDEFHAHFGLPVWKREGFGSYEEFLNSKGVNRGWWEKYGEYAE